MSRTELKNETAPGKAVLFSYLELIIIIALACVPLFLTFPYRVNIFLSWEGAYRLSQGHVPFKDFGMPMGYVYWVVPSFFFKLFGPQLITLVKAQVFINIISGLAFRSILNSLQVNNGVRLLSVLLYCLSFSFFNFWPWYNHSVVVYEFVAIAFLLKHIFSDDKYVSWAWLFLSAVFCVLSFFTKQDAGGLCIGMCLVLLAASIVYTKKFLPLALFAGFLLLAGGLFIFPYLEHNLSYWFNYGQAPSTARLSVMELIGDFFAESQWIKFYLFLTVLLSFAKFKKLGKAGIGLSDLLFLLLTLGILAEAAILQVTSYTPPDNNIFFHAFAFAFLFSQLSALLQLDFLGWKPLLIGTFGLLLWWSGTYWKYIERIAQRSIAKKTSPVKGEENIVNRSTYKINPEPKDIPMSKWVFSGMKSFEKIYMPKPTVEGIQRLKKLNLVQPNTNQKVLNMTELTPLAVELGFELEKGSTQPLWYHLGVAMFNKQAQMFENRIAGKHYDLVLFEHIPTLNNFYPFRVRDSLQLHYHKVDSFLAPRRGETQGMIEVYTPK
jgi:hypothetical protein